ncbi:catalase-related domain-containing protein [Paraburkholderia hospita]|uniref:catalase-related domain-containing protein n=1 Tax=Paraburkholderia hospita TaxID=169430 RepID=UPI0039BDBB6F
MVRVPSLHTTGIQNLTDAEASQPGALFRLMSPEQKQALFDNTARAMAGVSEPIRRLHIEHCTKADPVYGQGVAAAIESARSATATPNRAL